MRVSMKFAISIVGILTISTTSQLEAKPANDNESKTDKSFSNNHKKDENHPKDDSDMLMKPNEFSHVSVIQSEGHQIYPGSVEHDNSQTVAEHGLIDSYSQAAQNFYPQFFNGPLPPPLGHSRPFATLDGNLPINRGNFPNSRSFDTSILGSGEFSVMRGGTFYPDDEQIYHGGDDDSEFNQFFTGTVVDSNNGHGRPQDDSYIHKFTYPEEQFANFRDFADINTPSDSAYSQFVVVYANKNSTETENHSRPKNIFEQLELLDKEKTLEEKKSKISKAKAKLANTKLEKKYKKKLNLKDVDSEPLLALS